MPDSTPETQNPLEMEVLDTKAALEDRGDGVALAGTPA
jgi:hypothetical protein